MGTGKVEVEKKLIRMIRTRILEAMADIRNKNYGLGLIRIETAREGLNKIEIENMPTEDLLEENCKTCSHRLSKNYHTVRCDVWTPRLKTLGYEADCECRIHSCIKCQFYDRLY